MGLIAPGGTPAAMVERINREVAEVLKQPDIREKLGTQLMEPIGNAPAQFRDAMRAEVKRWEPVIKAGNIKIN
jgi:tripartite-type tricarboxylate transporter receptor subunit TctC